MAPGTSSLGWLAAATVCVALVVTGCGGGSSSSAPATAGSTDPQTAENSQSANGDAEGGSNEKAGGETEGGTQTERGGGIAEKKNPPVEEPEGPSENGVTKEQEEKVPTAKIILTVPHGLRTDNTCKGKNVSPEISWTDVPPGTKELVIFAVSVEPVSEKLFFNWAMARVDPSVTSVKEGEVPEGAVLGRNGDGTNGWSLCPKKSGPESYIFTVYAIEQSLSPEEGFDPLGFRVKAGKASEEIGFAGVEFSG